jgi:hypothetical protein
MAVQYAFGQIVTNGLVLALDAADRNSYVSGSATWTDLSGNGNNGNISSSVSYNSSNGNNLGFNGTNSNIQIPYNAQLNGFSGSVSVWFNNAGTYATGNKITELIGNHASGGSFNGFGIAIASGSNCTVGAYIKNATTNYSISQTFTIINGIWNNATITYQTNNSLKLYNNGQFFSSLSLGTLSPGVYPTNIGVASDTFWSPYSGSVAIAQIYNRVLSDAEILQNYNAQRARFGL